MDDFVLDLFFLTNASISIEKGLEDEIRLNNRDRLVSDHTLD